MQGLVSKGTEKGTVGGMGNGSFQVVPLTESSKIIWRLRKDIKEGRAGGGKSGGRKLCPDEEYEKEVVH